MMPVVRISDATMKKLQPLAIPLQDSIDTLLNRLADAAHSGIPYQMPTMLALTSVPQQNIPSTWEVAPHDDLAFTRLISAEFNGVALTRVNWNSLAQHAHERAFQMLGSFEAVRRVTRARVKPGCYEQNGFVYLPDINMSIQGMDANLSWDNSVRLAHGIGASVSAVFEWRNNPKAVKSGQKSQLSFIPL